MVTKEATVTSIDSKTIETPKLSAAEKAEQAVELRKRRVSMTAIATKLEFSNSGAARSAIRGALMNRLGYPPERRKDIDIDLELELMSLDDLEAKLWLVLEGTDADTNMKGADRVLKIKTMRDDLRMKRAFSLRNI